MTHSPNTNTYRSIRSFVRRTGRVTKRQQEAYQRLHENIGIRFVPQTLPFSEIFKRETPLTLEIGFGMGEVIAEIAAANPHKNYIATDIHPAGIANLVLLIEEKELTNIRIIERDALDVLQHNISDSALSAIHIFFPDPWPKKRHHKRRLIKPETTRLFCRKLEAGGYIHVATDWQDYADKILEVFADEKGLRNTAAGFATRPQWRPVTKFEQKALKEGRISFDILFKRV
ncbi:MAG: tRNA (guanosine(46)-N7)-methyltransferase TrmB [bacterium]